MPATGLSRWCSRVCLLLSLSACPARGGTPDPMDWPHWRGPLQNGVSQERGLPESWSPRGENLLWRKPEYATCSTPVLFNGRLYTICRAFPESTQEGERIVCLNAESGDLIWETLNNIFLSDAPAERVGWSSVVADPETGNIYAMGLGCYFQCLDGQTGQVRWARSLSEEYGMLSTYGGRTNFPIVFENLVIISGVTTGWGDCAMPAHRFIAFDKQTGQAVWLANTRPRPEDTTYCTPVITTFNGRAAMVFGGGDGTVYAMEPRTGREIWKYDASNRGINTTPLVHDGIVYGGHSEQNASDTDVLGALFALDGRQKGLIAESDLLWKIPACTVGRSQPLLVGDRLYAVDDGGTLWVVDARTGQEVTREKVGRAMFGSMVYGDGKFYVVDANGVFSVLRPTDQGVKVLHKVQLRSGPKPEETLGSPAISRGRIYLATSGALYCIGQKDATPLSDPLPAMPQETPIDKDTQVAHLQISPVEVLLTSGDTQPLTVRAFNSQGQFLTNVAATFSVQGPATVDSTGLLVTQAAAGHATAIVTAEAGELRATTRVRIVPPLPWSFDFSDKQVPPTWIGAAHRHQPKELAGEAVLVKVTTIPKGTRSQAWMGPTNLHDYTIRADFLATERDGKLPDMGLINQRYTLVMNAAQDLQIRSWASRLELRFAKTIPFTWQANTWYTMKFQSENAGGQAVLRGKVWPRAEPEPADWTIEAADATPNTVGSPGLFGNAGDAEFYLDNVKVEANS